MKHAKSPGRPRAFDPDAALETAMRLFWQKGYEGTSLTDLTEAIGINRPSLYAAFGNKEELFRRAREHYAAKMGTGCCEDKSLRQTVEDYLYGVAEGAANPEHAGCLLVVSCLAGSDESGSVQRELCEARNALQDVWRQRFERAKAEGELPQEADAAALAGYLMTVSNGMSVQARSGATAENLRRIAEIALKSLR
ncbi:TetR/AcrR family transcriptional regulator [bacterium]|nr:MAG: TetR/AcrR family transcriptional regulator [bacterium]